MAATLRIWLTQGASAGTTSDVTAVHVRHKQADNATVDLNNPVPIPSSGDNYALPKHFKLAATTTPSQTLTNLRWFADPRPTTGDPATEWAGVTMWAGLTATYLQASTTVPPDTTTKRPGLADADTYTSAAPLTVFAGTLITNPATGPGSQNFVMVQMSVNSTAISGAKEQRQCYYRIEEI